MTTKKLLDRREFIGSLTAAGMSLPFILSGARKGLAANPDMSHEFHIFSKHLQFLPDYTAMAQVAAEIGFDGVELSVRPGGHVLPENVEKDLPLAVEAVKNAGLKVTMIVTNLSAADDPFTMPILKTAAGLGIKYYRMGYIPFDKKIGVEKSLDQIKTRLAALIEISKKYGINAAYQNHSGDKVGGPVWDLWLLMKDFDPRWISCQYDVRHGTVEGAYSWPLAMELIVPYIKTTVIKDFYWKIIDGKWKVYNCPLGEGMVDFKKYFQQYKISGLKGPISLHFEYDHYTEHDSLENRRRWTVDTMKKDLSTLKKMIEQWG